jgi:hypothetical protein
MVHIYFTADHVTNHDLSRWPAYDLTILIETIPLPSDPLSTGSRGQRIVGHGRMGLTRRARVHGILSGLLASSSCS